MLDLIEKMDFAKRIEEVEKECEEKIKSQTLTLESERDEAVAAMKVALLPLCRRIVVS